MLGSPIAPRLPWENNVASFVEPRRPAHVPVPTPIHKTDAFFLSRPASAGEMPLPEIQPSDIEEIPGYELLGVLGRGGMGLVFRARQVSLKRQVALKMILTGRNARADDRVRFQKEAEAVARLQHPNIVQIYEVGQQNGLPYFSLEFVNAGSLAQFLGGIPQAPRVSAQLVQQLAGAMHYAHKRGIVHRDLKPANILLHLDESRILRNGQSADTTVFRELISYVPKISDFGLAMRVGGDEHLRHGTIVGTPSYMAPEQAGRAGSVGPPADVVRAGGDPVRDADGPAAVQGDERAGDGAAGADAGAGAADAASAEDSARPGDHLPDLPAKGSRHRYGSAAALGEDLRRFLADEPILAHPAPLPNRVVKWAHRRPATAVSFVAAALVAAGLIQAWGQFTYAHCAASATRHAPTHSTVPPSCTTPS